MAQVTRIVTLTQWEMYVAGQAAVARQIENIGKSRKNAHGAPDRLAWQLHVEGCLGEIALAKYLGIYWSGKGRLRAPDVGRMDVRTNKRHNGDLILHDDDPDDRPFWLLTGGMNKFVVQGWLFARDGKKDEYWADPAGNRPAYFVPQHVLNDVTVPVPPQ